MSQIRPVAATTTASSVNVIRYNKQTKPKVKKWRTKKKVVFVGRFQTLDKISSFMSFTRLPWVNHVKLSTTSLLWLCILLMHVMCALYLGIYSYMHWLIGNGNYEYEKKLSECENYRSASIILFGIAAAIHCVVIAEMFLRLRKWGSLNTLRSCYDLHPIFTPLKDFLSHEGKYGTGGTYYRMRIVMRQFIKIPSQIIQAYLMSIYVPIPYLSSIMTGVVFLNCILIQYILNSSRFSKFQKQAYSIIIDLFFGLASSIVISALLIQFLVPYFTASLIEQARLQYTDDWFGKAIFIGRKILVTSSVDILTRILPFISYVDGLRTVEDILQRQTSSRHFNLAQLGVLSSRDVNTSKSRRNSRFYSTNLMYFFLLCSGTFFFVAIISSGYVVSRIPCGDGCLAETAPWFTLRCTCKTQEVNCRRRQLLDGANLSEIVRNIDDQLFILIISECNALRMPPEIHRFKKLFGMKVNNVSISDWGVDAALEATFFPELSYLLLLFTNLTDIPDGLLVELPYNLNYMEIAYTPLNDLPMSLPDYWGSVGNLYVEYANFSRVPSVIGILTGVYQLSLSGNNIEEFPVDILLNLTTTLYSLALIKTPIQEIAIDLMNGSTLNWLSIDYTDISALPSLSPSFEASFSCFTAMGAPLCAELPSNNTFPQCITDYPQGWVLIV